MPSTKPTATQYAEVRGYERFLEEQNGVYPATYAAQVLKISLQALHMAAKSGHIKYFKVGNKRLYGLKSVRDYRWFKSRKFRDNGNQRANDV